MYFIDSVFKCREIILSTNAESIDGYKKILQEWDEYLRYYDDYADQNGHTRRDYERELLGYSLDEDSIEALTEEEALYLTDRIIKMNEDGTYILLKIKEHAEWLSLAEFDMLLLKHIKKRGGDVSRIHGHLRRDETDHKIKEPRSLEELLHYFDELENNDKLKTYWEDNDEDNPPVIEAKDPNNVVDEIMAGLGLTAVGN